MQSHVIFPAAGYVEMMFAAAGNLLGGEAAILQDLDFRKALVVTDEEPPATAQLRCNVERRQRRRW